MKVVAKYADTWNTYGGWNFSSQQTVEILRQRSELLAEYCLKLKRNPDEIRHSFLAGITADTPFASLNAFYDLVSRLRDIGFSEFIFYYDYPAIHTDKSMDHAMLERIATEAIPAIRAQEAKP